MLQALMDTNTILRFITNDVPAQAEKIEKRFRQAQNGKLELIILPLTIVEIFYQLQKWYGFTKEESCDKVSTLLVTSWIKVDHKTATLEALNNFKDKNIDLVDLLLWSFAKDSKQKVLSFDKDFDKLIPEVRLIP